MGVDRRSCLPPRVLNSHSTFGKALGGKSCILWVVLLGVLLTWLCNSSAPSSVRVWAWTGEVADYAGLSLSLRNFAAAERLVGLLALVLPASQVFFTKASLLGGPFRGEASAGVVVYANEVSRGVPCQIRSKMAILRGD